MTLRPSGDSGPNFVTACLLFGVQWKVMCSQRTWTDERHVAFEDVPKLGEFVDGGGADETAYFGQALGVREELAVGVAFISHGLELYHLEDLGVLAGTFLKEEGSGSLVGEVEPGGDGGQGYGQDEEGGAGGGYVYGSLEEVSVWFHMSCQMWGITQSLQRGKDFLQRSRAYKVIFEEGPSASAAMHPRYTAPE